MGGTKHIPEMALKQGGYETLVNSNPRGAWSILAKFVKHGGAKPFNISKKVGGTKHLGIISTGVWNIFDFLDWGYETFLTIQKKITRAGMQAKKWTPPNRAP